MITAMKWFTKELHGMIDIFNIRMGKRLYESKVLDLSSLREEVATLSFEVHALVESHTFVIPPIS